jgi:hypothetical protein
MPTEKIQIVKIPAVKSKDDSDKPKAFPSMPRLYLELLENKKKVKPELVNTEYVHKESEEVEETGESPAQSSHTPISSHSYSSSSSIAQPKSNNMRSTRPSPQSDKSDKSNRSNKTDETEVNVQSRYSDSSRHSRHSRHSDTDTIESRRSLSKSSAVVSTPRSSRSSGYKKKDDSISNRLQELLDETDNEVVDVKPKPATVKIPPSLSELEKAGKVKLTKEAQEAPGKISEQDQDDLKREYLYKFEILQKSYKNTTIPEFTIHSDFQTIKRTYESTLRMLSLDQTVDDYKKYAGMAFGAIEFVLGSVFNFDMAGYAAQQQLNMNSYERLLVELGEKSYVPNGSKYPVEIRLLFMLIINTAFFLVTKIVLKKTGVNLSTNLGPQQQTSQPEKKRKMRGPVVNVDDIPDSISVDDK